MPSGPTVEFPDDVASWVHRDPRVINRTAVTNVSLIHKLKMQFGGVVSEIEIHHLKIYSGPLVEVRMAQPSNVMCPPLNPRKYRCVLCQTLRRHYLYWQLFSCAGLCAMILSVYAVIVSVWQASQPASFRPGSIMVMT